MIYELASKPEVASYIDTQNPLDDVITRIDAWLTERGYIQGERIIEVRADGSVVVDTDRDPSEEWNALDLTMTKEERSTFQQRKQFITNQLTALDAGTATPVNIQRILAWLVRDRFDMEQP